MKGGIFIPKALGHLEVRKRLDHPHSFRALTLSGAVTEQEPLDSEDSAGCGGKMAWVKLAQSIHLSFHKMNI